MIPQLIRRTALVLLALASACAMAGAPVKNKPPVVSLTSPTAGASYSAPATVQLSATASDTDGTVAKVDFYRGNTLIASVAAAPYNFTWTNVAIGTYSITAKATDNAGGTATSTAVSINVAAASTQTTITSPTAATLFDWGVTDVTGTFSGTADTTILVNNGNGSTVLGTQTSATTFLASNVWLAPGSNTITATAVRRDGTASSGSVTVDMPKRLIVVTSPLKDASYEMPPSVTLQSSALVASGSVQRVDYYRMYVGKLGSATTPPYTFIWNNPPKDRLIVYAQLVDDKGRTQDSAAVSFNVTGPNVPPTVSMMNPVDGSTYGAPATVQLGAQATDSDGAVTQVDFLQNGQMIGSTNISPYKSTVSSLPEGTYTFSARATDNNGASTVSAPITLFVKPDIVPSVTLFSSAPDTVLPVGSSVTFTATVVDNGGGVGTVDFYDGATRIGSRSLGPYVFTWNGISAGTHTITARAYSAVGGNGATSNALTLRVSSDAALMVDPGIDGTNVSDTQVIVSGRVAAPVNAGITINGQLAAYDRAGRFVAAVPLEVGVNTLTVLLSTEPGLTATQVITVTRDTPNDAIIAQAMSFSVEPNEVFAGDQVTFTARMADGTVFNTLEVDLDGNGTTDFTLPGTSLRNGVITFTATYPTAGIYRVKATRMDQAGEDIVTEETVLNVITPAVIDGISRGLWGTINGALSAGNKATAMMRLTEPAQEKYGPVFDTLMPQMPVIVGGYSGLIGTQLSVDMSEYVVNQVIDGVNQAFFVYFIEGGDGVWRLESY